MEALDDAQDALGDPWELFGVEPDLAEAYAELDVVMHIHAPWRLLSSVPQKPQPGCAVLHALPSLGNEIASEGGRLPGIVRAKELFQLVEKISGFQSTKGRIDDAVLVRVGEFGKDGKRMAWRSIARVVWLNPLHKCPMFGAEVGDAAVAHRFELGFGLRRNRELRFATIGRAVTVEQSDLADRVMSSNCRLLRLNLSMAPASR